MSYKHPQRVDLIQTSLKRAPNSLQVNSRRAWRASIDDSSVGDTRFARFSRRMHRREVAALGVRRHLSIVERRQQ